MPSTPPLVSVIITTYNRRALLCEALRSVFSQDFQDFEIIVVDDGGSDGSPAVATEFDSRLRYIITANNGQPAARNTGIAASRGAFIAFLDDDDLWLPRRLSASLAALECEPRCQWAHCRGRRFARDPERSSPIPRRPTPHAGWISRHLLEMNFLLSAGITVRRRFLLDFGGFDTDIKTRIGEDWLMWLRFAARSPIACINEELCLIRQHATNMSKPDRQRLLSQAISYTRVQLKAAQYEPNAYRSLLQHSVAYNWATIGRLALTLGMTTLGRRLIRSAFRAEPLSTRNAFYLAMSAFSLPPIRWP